MEFTSKITTKDKKMKGNKKPPKNKDIKKWRHLDIFMNSLEYVHTKWNLNDIGEKNMELQTAFE